MQVRHHPGIGHHHLTAHPAQYHGPKVDDERVSVHQLGKKAARKDDKGDGETEDQEEEVALRHTCDREDVVGAHHEVGDHDGDDSLLQGFHLLLELVLGRSFHEQLHRDPEDEKVPEELDAADGKELRRHEGEPDPEHHRRRRANDDACPALLGCERAHRHGNDHGVVAREDEIDEHNAQ